MDMDMDSEMDPSFIKEVLDQLNEEAKDKEMEGLANVLQPADEPLPSSKNQKVDQRSTNQQQDHHQFDYSLPHYPTYAQLEPPVPPLPPVFLTTPATTSFYPSYYYPSFPLLDTTTPIGHFLFGNPTADLTNNNPGIFNGSNNMFMGPDHLPLQEQDFQGESVVTFGHETMPRTNNFRSTPLSPEISSQEDAYKKREYRKEKIAKFRIKRKTLNYSNRTQYLSRKKGAESRPRVSGRFVKMARSTCGISNHDQDKIKLIEKKLMEEEEEEEAAEAAETEAFADSLEKILMGEKEEEAFVDTDWEVV